MPQNSPDHARPHAGPNLESVPDHGPPPLDALHLGRAAVRRRPLRTAGLAVAGAAAVGGGLMGALALSGVMNTPDSAPVVAGVASPGAEGGPATQAAPLELDWRIVPSEAPVGNPTVIGADGTYYSVSTTPGLRFEDIVEGEPTPLAVYRSTDGETWEAIEVEGDRSLSSLGERGGLLYAVSTTPAADGYETTVASSTDGGATWADLAQLPAPGPGPEPAELFAGPSHVVSLAIGDEAMLATRTAWAYLDSEAVSELVDAPAGAYIVVEGDDWVAYQNEEPSDECIEAAEAAMGAIEADAEPKAGLDRGADCWVTTEVGRGPLSDLGVDPGTLDLWGAFQRTEHFVSHDDGASWTPVELSDEPVSWVDAVNGDLVAFIPPPPESVENPMPTGTGEVLRSSDGVTWTPMAVPEGVYEISGALGDRLVAVGLLGEPVEGEAVYEMRPAVYLMTADGGWETLDLESALGADVDQVWVEVAVGPLGVMLAGQNEDELVLAVSADGSTWSTTTGSELGVEPASWMADQTVGADRFTVTLASTTPRTSPVDSWMLVGTPRR